MPPHSCFVEPFVGGGALFFDLSPRDALLSDASRELVDFYRAVQARDPRFREALMRFAHDREALRRRVAREGPDFAALVARARMGTEGLPGEPLVRAAAATPLSPCVAAGEAIAASVADKAARLVRLERKHGVHFTIGELPDHYETALQAGYYTAVRDHFVPPDPAAEVARFFFLRTYCYGSMFRYSRAGKFNIPYGGISYNRIRLAGKVDRLFSPELNELLARAEFFNADFEAHLAAIRPRLTNRAFVFFDPPYDSDFSGYAGLSFGRDDHERLARVFAALPCPGLVVIQRTDFIHALYDRVGRERRTAGLPFFMKAYGKQYGYNVRGRNDRNATHLLVGNYLLGSRTRTGSPSRSAE